MDAELSNLPTIGRFNWLAVDLLVKITAAAPSVIYEEFPPVEAPSLEKAGFNLFRDSRVVSLIPSSLSTMISLLFPSLSLIRVLTGVISSFNHPFF